MMPKDSGDHALDATGIQDWEAFVDGVLEQWH